MISKIDNRLERIELGVQELKEEIGKDLDPFDLVCHVAFGRPPLTRKERVTNVKKQDYFTKYEGRTREVIDALLDKYADQGITAILLSHSENLGREV